MNGVQYNNSLKDILLEIFVKINRRQKSITEQRIRNMR